MVGDMQPLAWISILCFLLYISCGSAEFYRQISAGSQAGLCRYGTRLDCCYGWKKNSKGRCEAQCQHGCKHGECIGPNKCKCSPGYTGKTCSQDLNECGLKPRPCEHRCMNTHGSYMCYCLNGYTLMPDGSCANSRTCALAHCQYGCEEVQSETRCQCPSTGLRLGPDQRTCVDIDECASGRNLCPHNRRCVNTFGSYYCKCQSGYDLKYAEGKYDCTDIDECAERTHKCSHHADCLNTAGSYRCKCKPGFRGSGFECTVKPFYQSTWDGDKGSADEFLNAIPDSPVKPPRVLSGSRLDGEQLRNAIPEPEATAPPRVPQQPFDYDGEVYIGNPGEDRALEEVPEREAGGDPEEEEDNQENQIDNQELNPRGDVFFPEGFKSVFGPSTEVKDIPTPTGHGEFITDCDFDQGACEWVQDKDDDFDWSLAYNENGVGYYMAASGPSAGRNGQARLRLLLAHRPDPARFCLTFNYRLKGASAGTLRVLLDNNDHPVWERSHSRQRGWQTELLTVAWEEEEAPQSVIFEAMSGTGAGGEIGLDNVVLTSGSCQEDDSVIF